MFPFGDWTADISPLIKQFNGQRPADTHKQSLVWISQVWGKVYSPLWPWLPGKLGPPTFVCRAHTLIRQHRQSNINTDRSESQEENKRRKKEQKKFRNKGEIKMPVSACAKGLLKTDQRHLYDNNAESIVKEGGFKLRIGCNESNVSIT